MDELSAMDGLYGLEHDWSMGRSLDRSMGAAGAKARSARLGKAWPAAGIAGIPAGQPINGQQPYLLEFQPAAH
jgi:hypothetical protein